MPHDCCPLANHPVRFGTADFLAATFFACMRFRLSAGYEYPPFSTLNARPDGCEVLFRALARQPGQTVIRLHDPGAPLPDPTGCTLFLLDFPLSALTREHLAFVMRGGRIILTPRSDDNIKNLSLGAQSFSLPLPQGIAPTSDSQQDPQTLTRMEESTLLPSTLHTPVRLQFSTRYPRWRCIYRSDHHGIVLERQTGRGSLVLLGAPDLLSNAQLAAEPDTSGLLCWLAGDANHLLFSELQHGGTHRRTLAVYAWKLRLHGFVVGLLLVFLLYLWRQCGNPLPLRLQSTPNQIDQLSGLTRLLQKNLPAADALRAAWACWCETAPTLTPELEQAAEQILNHRPPYPILEGYHRLHDLTRLNRATPANGLNVTARIFREK